MGGGGSRKMHFSGWLKNLQRGKGIICFTPALKMRGRTNVLPLFLLLAYLCKEDSLAIDTITITAAIQDPQSIVSSGQTYRLGFFSPGKTGNRYVGIMLNTPELTVMWVANRDRPLRDSSGMVAISEDGNLVVLNGHKEILWSSGVSKPTTANSSAQLLDTGNLVLRDNSNGRALWESFHIPTDHFVETMKLGVSARNKNLQLTSWRSPSDPSIGNFSLGFDPLRIPEAFVWNNGKPYWRSGPWNGNVFIGVPGMTSAYRRGISFVNDDTGATYVTYDDSNVSMQTYNVLTFSGSFQQKVYYDGKGNPKETWSTQETECNIYGKCGPFGVCDPKSSPICSCLLGFEPRDMAEWRRGNWTGGCLRKEVLQCRSDGFVKLSNIKVPDLYYVVDYREWKKEAECGKECLNNCTCEAYSFVEGIGCMHWSGNLLDMQQFGFDGSDLHLRVAYSELEHIESERDASAVIPIIAAAVSFFIVVGFAYSLWKWFAKSQGEMKKMRIMLADQDELHLYSYDTMANATDHFNPRNILGEGGFGPVYKGKLSNGREIAVKTLSNSSTQGSEEFMNEVVVISKLQHRNLVRLFGCCVQRQEKMLVYEYMPNKSLDAYLLDSSEQDLLDWKRRQTIIDGISRGLTYLHRDSRLKIIHRDLKASNILLDAEFNPKIADFGLARIVGGNQDQAKTNRVIGTYGYMAPEYAMRGKFSDKSDVYSFGVLLLEILSGKRNASFYDAENGLSLIGNAWKLWHQNETAKFLDQSIISDCNEVEISRYIQVGLLCVQEYAKDRPNMCAVLSMLKSEIAELPRPKLPAYAATMLCSLDSECCQPCLRPSIDVPVTVSAAYTYRDWTTNILHFAMHRSNTY